eukprot:gene17963-20821_t
MLLRNLSRSVLKRKLNSGNFRLLSHHETRPPIPVEGKTVAQSQAEYLQNYKQSIEDPNTYWAKQANQYLSWFTPFSKTLEGEFAEGSVKWFEGGKLNACYNAIDRHV